MDPGREPQDLKPLGDRLQDIEASLRDLHRKVDELSRKVDLVSLHAAEVAKQYQVRS